MTAHILQEAKKFKEQIVHLKIAAPVYPQMYSEAANGSIWITAMVPFAYNGVNYLRHHVESIVPNSHVGKPELLEKFKQQAALTMEHAVPCHLDDIVGLVK